MVHDIAMAAIPARRNFFIVMILDWLIINYLIKYQGIAWVSEFIMQLAEGAEYR